MRLLGIQTGLGLMCSLLTCMAVAQSKLSFSLGSLPKTEAATASPKASAYTLLQSILEQAVQTHPSIKVKLAEQSGSQANVDAAKWQYYPTPSLTTERGNQDSYRDNTYVRSTTLRLQQSLWAGGRIDAGVDSARMKSLAAQWSVAEAQLNVALQTLSAWQNLLTAWGRKEAAQMALQRLERLNDMLQRRVQNQVSPQIDAELMYARLVQAKSDSLSATFNLEATKKRLTQWAGDVDALGLDDEMLRLALKEQAPSIQRENEEQLQTAIDQHPSLLRNQADTAAAQHDVTQKKAEAWPTVYARVDRQLTEYNTAVGVITETKVYLGLQYTPGAGLSLGSLVNAAQSRVYGLQAERETTRKELQDRFESEWRDYQALLQRQGPMEESKNSTAEVLESYTRLFVAGRKSWLEVLNAVRELSQTEQSWSDLQAQRLASALRLRLYLGELAWQNGE
jgi:outer membrane protein, adhesin transport system